MNLTLEKIQEESKICMDTMFTETNRTDLSVKEVINLSIQNNDKLSLISRH